MSQDKQNQGMQGEAAGAPSTASHPRLIIKRDIGPKIAAKTKELRLQRAQRLAAIPPTDNEVKSPEGES